VFATKYTYTKLVMELLVYVVLKTIRVNPGKIWAPVKELESAFLLDQC
jgi:hypothetical protein